MGPELGAIMLVRPPIVVYGYVVTVGVTNGDYQGLKTVASYL